MAKSHTHISLDEVKDSAPQFGLGDNQEARFAKDDLEAESVGVSHVRLKPGKRQPFGHRHEEAEEVYVILSGSGRLKLEDEIIEVERLDAIRVSPQMTRAFEAGPEGLEILACGPRHDGDGEIIPGWWSE
ncbi:MAG TPA: cupin domain-containing protein [Solirubrobacterales bacterium]|jgi:mannose-6-phosphate isomerase-like protein (cupin superfamily)